MTLTSDPSLAKRPGPVQAELLAAGAWSARHGVARFALSRARKQGDLQAQLFTDPAARADPFPIYARIRSRGPVVRGKFMATTASHAVADGALRSDAFGVVSDPEALPPLARWLMTRPNRTVGPVTPPSLLAVDPPDHTRYRKLVSKVFTARAMAALRPRVASLADELLDGLSGRSDIVGSYASLLPVTIIAEILGVPADMRSQFVAWGSTAAPVLDVGLSYREYRRVDRAIRELNGWMSGHFARLRRSPGDDLLSRLVQEEESLTETELLAIAGLLLAAGFETTVNLIGNGVSLLLAHPSQLALLLAEGGWDNAVEEILRYESPVQNTARRALRDTEVAGVPVRAGTFLSILIGGANRDPAVFADPERFDVRRANAREHLAFSSGVHYCLGASLARIEGEEALRRLFERYPDLTAAGRPRRRPTRTLRGFDELPVALHA
ncbi:cytochrome P450 [Cryptosporangium phraense]|uniref:Cytochrome P450 n=1 Tax=Cryptosporangium phraense TaxID=2593070 RepID=A0A545B2N7_9ACTN|nr:cytochrome P450 [Cryptosporangium phraense]TQS47105.1 cytochrome P450 [Cryptosporangium phraense]